MGKIKEFIKTNPSLREAYRLFLKYGKDRCFTAFPVKRVYRQSKGELYRQLHPSKAVLAKESSLSLSLSKQPSLTVAVSIASEQLSLMPKLW